MKTRQLGNELWKAGDGEMTSALVRFAKLERDYPDQFYGYTIATNHQFFEVRDNGSNLPFLLRLSVELVDGVALTGCLATFVRKLIKQAESNKRSFCGYCAKRSATIVSPSSKGFFGNCATPYVWRGRMLSTRRMRHWRRRRTH